MRQYFGHAFFRHSKISPDRNVNKFSKMPFSPCPPLFPIQISSPVPLKNKLPTSSLPSFFLVQNLKLCMFKKILKQKYTKFILAPVICHHFAGSYCKRPSKSTSGQPLSREYETLCFFFFSHTKTKKSHVKICWRKPWHATLGNFCF